MEYDVVMQVMQLNASNQLTDDGSGFFFIHHACRLFDCLSFRTCFIEYFFLMIFNVRSDRHCYWSSSCDRSISDRFVVADSLIGFLNHVFLSIFLGKVDPILKLYAIYFIDYFVSRLLWEPNDIFSRIF